MRKKQGTFYSNILVFAVVAIYFITATTHIFFIPCITEAGKHQQAPSGNSIFKRKPEYVSVAGNYLNFVQRADKSTLEERRAVSDSIKTMLSFYTILLFVLLVWRMKPKFFREISHWLIQPRHSYLSLCVIRI